jgi:ABC-type glycerol-3-phosphate transport system permease component
MKKNAGSIITRIVIYFFIIVPAIIWFTPILSTVFLSMKTETEIVLGAVWEIPRKLQFETVINAFNRIKPYLRNSIIITVPAAIFSVTISALGAFVLARRRFRGRNLILFYFLGGMMIPYTVCLIPLFILMKNIGLYNTYWAQILTNISFGIPICTFILRNFFITIPRDLEAAAIIDGCSAMGVFTRIVIPISLPTVATLIGFQFIYIWNSLVWGLVLAINENVQPVMVGILNLKGSYEMAWNLTSAAAMISMLLPMMTFFLLQKYLAIGVVAESGIKG